MVICGTYYDLGKYRSFENRHVWKGWKRRGRYNPTTRLINFENLEYGINLFQKTCNGNSVIWDQYLPNKHCKNLSIWKSFYSQLRPLNISKLNGIPTPTIWCVGVCVGWGGVGDEDIMRFVYCQGERNTIPNRFAYGASSIFKHIGIAIVIFWAISKLCDRVSNLRFCRHFSQLIL